MINFVYTKLNSYIQNTPSFVYTKLFLYILNKEKWLLQQLQKITSTPVRTIILNEKRCKYYKYHNLILYILYYTKLFYNTTLHYFSNYWRSI